MLTEALVDSATYLSFRKVSREAEKYSAGVKLPVDEECEALSRKNAHLFLCVFDLWITL